MHTYPNPFQIIQEIINDPKLTNKAKFQRIIELIDTFEGSDEEAEYIYCKVTELNHELRKDIGLAHKRHPLERYIRFLVSLHGTSYPMSEIRQCVLERFGDVDDKTITKIATRAKGRGRTSSSRNNIRS